MDKMGSPFREQTYSTLGKGKSSLKVPLVGGIYVASKEGNQFLSWILVNGSYTVVECYPQLVQPSHLHVMFAVPLLIAGNFASKAALEKKGHREYDIAHYNYTSNTCSKSLN